MKPSQVSQCDLGEAVLGLVDAALEPLLLVDEAELALGVELPGVVLALEAAGVPAHLLHRVVLPHELVAAVGAHVVEGAHDAVAPAGDEERGVHARGPRG